MVRHVDTLIADPKIQVSLAVSILTALALWAFTQAFVPPASKACLTLYRAAKTADDTLQVDVTVPGVRCNPEPGGAQLRVDPSGLSLVLAPSEA